MGIKTLKEILPYILMVYHKINCQSCGGSYESKHIKRHCETSKHKFSLLSSEDQKIITEEKIQTQKEKEKEKYQKNKEIIKEWQNDNKDKTKDYKKKYYEANKEKSIDASKKYYEKNKEKIWAKMYNKILPN